MTSSGARGRRPRSQRAEVPYAPSISSSRRVKLIGALVLVGVIVLIARLAWVQVIWGPALAEQAREQRERVYVDPARRGTITDSAGAVLGYTMQARSLTVSPELLRKELREDDYNEMRATGATEGRSDEDISAELDSSVEETLESMARGIPKMLREGGMDTEGVKEKQLLDKLHADTHYEVLVRDVDPDIAAAIAEEFHGVAADQQDIREYPNGAVGDNIIGRVSMDGEGQFGLESSANDLLAGSNGRKTEEVSTNGEVIPGTMRDKQDAVDGHDVQLTIDLELQAYVQQLLEQAKTNSQAEGAEAVVLDAHTGAVKAMANTDTIDPNGDIERQLGQKKTFENPTISNPFEPGSAAKIITAAAAIEEGVTTPDEVHQVPGSIDMAGVTVADAWEHGTVAYTTTGIFGKSSNVGTLMLAQRVGEQAFDDYLRRFGVGEATGIELPNESAGVRPDLEDWGGGTFANLPIGQGFSMTTLQMASVFQALANGGERIQPRIIESVTNPDGEQVEQPVPATNRVVSAETARTVLDMFRAVTQSDPTGVQEGTGSNGAVEGYQTSGKTGTAQKVNPETGAYSMSDYWITFGGVAPADSPRYVIAVMVDGPGRGVEPGGSGGQSAAPIYRDITSWLMDHENVPLSKPMEGQLVLEAH